MNETVIPYDEYNIDMSFLSSLSEKIATHRMPISELLNRRHKYSMDDFPSYPEYVMLCEKADPRFVSILEKIEYNILQGGTYAAAVKAVENENGLDFVALKGNQILHGMVAKDKQSSKSDDKSEKKGGMDVLALLDKIDPTLLAGIKDQIECK